MGIITRQSVSRALIFLGLAASLASGGCGGCGDNAPPEVILNPAELERTYVVGDQIRIEVLAEDPDGDDLTFDYTWRSTKETLSIDDHAQLNRPGDSSAIFIWAPEPGDVTFGEDRIELIFTVSDGTAEVQRNIFLKVLPGNSSPRFENSTSELYTNCCDDPLVIEVKVRDDDSGRVEISMLQGDAPAGSAFMQTDDKKAKFLWTPTGDQAKKRVHAVTFMADDGDNPPVQQKVTIVIPPEGSTDGPNIKDPTADLCTGERAITHTPLGPQRSDDASFPVSATLTSQAAARYDKATIFWSYADPLTGNAQPLAVDMQKAGTELTGAIPNARLSTPGVETLFYRICLIDTMNPESADAVLCAPTVSYNAFNVYGPDDQGCAEDALDINTGNDSFDRAAGISLSRWENFKLCTGNKDFHFLRLREGQKVRVLVSYPQGNEPLLRVYDGMTEAPQLARKSDCAGLTIVDLEGKSDNSYYYLELVGDDVPYYVNGVELQKGGDCKDTAREPNDAAGEATTLEVGSEMTNLEICPDGDDTDVYQIDLEDGDQVEVVMRHMAAANNLDMTLFGPWDAGNISKGSPGAAQTFDINNDMETLTAPAPGCGTHYLLVFNNNESAASYSLEANVSPASCVDDDKYTCNRSAASAPLVPRNQDIGLQICPGRADWLKIPSAFGGVAYTASLTTSGGDLSSFELEAYDIEGNLLASGKANGGKLELSYTPENNGDLLFKVSADAAADYTIRFSDAS